MLLLRFGILSIYFEELRKTKFKDKRYKIRVYGLKITDRKSINLFYKKIGFSSSIKNKKLKRLVQKLKNKKNKSNVDVVPIGYLLREIRKIIRLPKKETHAIFLDSYMYNKRRIRRNRLPIIIDYLNKKVEFLEKLNLEKKNQLKKAINLLKIKLRELAKVSGNTENTVHQYLYSNKTRVSEKSISKLCKKIQPYILKVRKVKSKILRKILQKLKKISKENVGFVKVTKIEKVDNNYEYVYDITALENHNYIVNGLIVHNTTGKPKGILHDTGGYLTQAYWTTKWDFDLHDEDIFWCTADIAWITGHTYTCYGPLLNGATLLIYEGAPDFPKPDRWCEIIEKYGVTVFYTAPTAIRMFVKFNGRWVRKHDLSSLRILGTVGEPINREAWLWYFEEVGQRRCPIIDTWWQTETGGTLINSLPGIGPFIPTVAGRSFPGTRHEVVDEEGKILPPGKEGNLVQLSPFAPGMLKGVYKNPKKYFKTYWEKYGDKYFTSDGAWKDKEGNFRLTGRVDDVMKVAGHRLATAELEDAITRHHAVAECAVVPMSHEIKGEVPVAFVILKEAKPSEQIKKELVKQVEKYIGPIARPNKIIFVEDLPKTRSGKIIRRILKNLLINQPPGDVTTLANPESVEKIKKRVEK
jgi:non-ribosomal peptide synthetase component E (peptide arylation enzyme)